MPNKVVKARKYRRRRNTRKYRVPPRALARRGTLAPLVIPLKQTTCHSFSFNSAGDAGWTADATGIYKQHVFQLSDLGSDTYTRIENFMAQYKIMAVRQEFFFGSTGSIGTVVWDSQNNAKELAIANQNLMWYSVSDPVGQSIVGDQQYFLTRQNTKKAICMSGSRKPLINYNKMRQLTDVYASHTGGGTDYASTKPRWISTQEPHTQHYGNLSRIEIIDLNQQGSEKPPVAIKVYTTYYMLLRQVRGL